MLAVGNYDIVILNGFNFNYLFSPLIFTSLKLKRRPATASIVSYDMDSCPFCTSYCFSSSNKYFFVIMKGLNKGSNLKPKR